MYSLSRHFSEEIEEYIQAKLEKYESEVPVKLFIDGKEIELEKTLDKTTEVERDGGEIWVKKTFGLREILLRHPDEYDEELHGYLFTEEEKTCFFVHNNKKGE